MNELLRRYPFDVRPGDRETPDSYTRRVLEANFENDQHQKHLLGLAATTPGAPNDWGDILATKTGRTTPGNQRPARTPQCTCAQCTAVISNRFLCVQCAHGETIPQVNHFDTNVCVKHTRWTGGGTLPAEQVIGGHELIRAERTFRTLLREQKMTIAFYRILESVCPLVTEGSGTGRSTRRDLHYVNMMKLAQTLTSTPFLTGFFNPNQSFATAFEALARIVPSIIPDENLHATGALWLYFRPTFFSLRESLTSAAPYAVASPHDSVIPPAVLDRLAAPSAPLEAFANYLLPSGDDKLNRYNAVKVIVHDSPAAHTAMTMGGERKAPGICRAGHRFERIFKRMMADASAGNEKCPFCENQLVLRGTNDMATTHPLVAAQWHPTKNGTLTPRDIVAGSRTMCWWSCQLEHEYPATASNRTAAHSACTVCANRAIIIGRNDLATTHPLVAAEWHRAMNEGSGPTEFSAGSNQLVWWLCANDHTFRDTIGNRTRGASCHTCVRLAKSSKLLTDRSDLLAEWHPTRNLPLRPSDITLGSNKVCVWLCPNGHSFEQRVDRRAAGQRCPICSHRKLEPGVNDIRTLHPVIVTEWHPHLNGARAPSKTLPGITKHWWECKANGHIREQSIYRRVKSGGCPLCDPTDRVIQQCSPAQSSVPTAAYELGCRRQYPPVT